MFSLHILILLSVLYAVRTQLTTTDPTTITTIDGAFIPDRPITAPSDFSTTTIKSSEMLIELHEDSKDDENDAKSSILSSISEENDFGNETFYINK